MKKYILKRVGISIVTVFVLVSVVFFLARLMPGGPFNDPKMSATAKANLSAYYGFDKPLLQQYLTYLNNLIHGNFGFSTKYPSRTVNDLLAGAFPYSADLGIRALCFAISFGLVFGIISALNRGNKIDLIFVIVAVFGTSVPDFIMGALLQHFFAVKWGLFPIAQYKGFSYTILPSIGLGFYTMASVSRIMRASMLEVGPAGLYQDSALEGYFEVPCDLEASDPERDHAGCHNPWSDGSSRSDRYICY